MIRMSHRHTTVCGCGEDRFGQVSDEDSRSYTDEGIIHGANMSPIRRNKWEVRRKWSLGYWYG